jgi:hypothetical protein
MESKLEELFWQLSEKANTWTIKFNRDGISAKASVGSKVFEGYVSYEDFEEDGPIVALEDAIDEALSGFADE